MTAPPMHNDPRQDMVKAYIDTKGAKGATINEIVRKCYGSPYDTKDCQLTCQALVSVGAIWHVGQRYRARTDAERATGRMEK